MAQISDGATEAPAPAPSKDGPLLIEGPKAAAESPIIDLEPIQSAAAGDTGSFQAAAPEQASRWRLAAYAPLAAAIAFAVALGAIAGAAATSGLLYESAQSPAAADATRALQASVAQLSSELATIKAGVANTQRSTGKLAERLDRAEKAQAEPAARLAKLQDSIDRLERRPQLAAAAPAPDITGSVNPPKEESRQHVAEGWRLRDYYDGRAVVENRNGTLFKIGPGSNVPGLGKVETIKRENGRVVVVTANGIIAASLEQRRPYYMPRW